MSVHKNMRMVSRRAKYNRAEERLENSLAAIRIKWANLEELWGRGYGSAAREEEYHEAWRTFETSARLIYSSARLSEGK